ncbi:hypothetical protein RJT34_07142 [Clitoria ternatea]|uniref:Uncharacterized protein n=1 Tax=Clitoria ternatea TaxID=43366 RepID=A0AAN9K311_CLITE
MTTPRKTHSYDTDQRKALGPSERRKRHKHESDETRHRRRARGTWEAGTELKSPSLPSSHSSSLLVTPSLFVSPSM